LSPKDAGINVGELKELKKNQQTFFFQFKLENQEKDLEEENKKYLDEIYPDKKTRKNVKELDLSSRDLTGHLDLTDFANLVKLDCSWNKITQLQLAPNLLLKEIEVNNNLLTDII
jgi:hypothetical protein